MSSDIKVSVRNIGKLYQIYDKPQDRLKQSFWQGHKKFYKEFWALRNVSFEVKRGETIGIVGRNGAGKSTLLQIIAGTLTPTEGEAFVNGRVAALLELGSGFNPIFTGRENMFLSGSILGISRQEMERHLDDIVSFADIGDFINQPVKIYSSGMFARLAFATAIHISASVLIIDEILAVGDAGFQRKCYRRLEEMMENGTSILFVTHSMNAVRKLCSKALYLERGKQKFFGPSNEVCDLYLEDILGEHVPPGTDAKQSMETSSGILKEKTVLSRKQQVTLSQYCTKCGQCNPIPKSNPITPLIQGNGDVKIVCVKLLSVDSDKTKIITGDSVEVRSRFLFSKTIKDFLFGILIRNKMGQDIFGVSKNSYSLGLERNIEAGEEIEIVTYLTCTLMPETYFITLGIQDITFTEVLFYGHDLVMFEVLRPPEEDPKMIGGIADLPHKIKIESL